MKLRQFFCASVLTLCAFASQANSDFVIEDIRIQGLQRVALGAALTYVPVQVGDSLSDFRVKQVIRSLYSS